jgi:hypothetical protein
MQAGETHCRACATIALLIAELETLYVPPLTAAERLSNLWARCAENRISAADGPEMATLSFDPGSDWPRTPPAELEPPMEFD